MGFITELYTLLFTSNKKTTATAVREMPQYARDFSEHCKRRDALPSVFLSKRVMEADAQVIHFSRLDTPYSCFSTIRTEVGHNILMVITMWYDNITTFCKDGNQLAVYEYPETFGGYWGPIPDPVFELNPELPVYTKQYTLPTRPTTVKTTTIETIQTSSSTESTVTRQTATTQDYITVEVPIVNLSASLIPDEKQEENPFDEDDFFDQFYDVAPRPGQSYETSILPLVQIAVKKQDARREGDGDGEPRYEIDYEVGAFTVDSRLTTPAWPKKINTNRNRNRWKKKKLQDKRVDHNSSNPIHTRRPAKFFRKQHSLPIATYPYYEHILPPIINENMQEKQQQFNLIDDIMQSLNESGDLKHQETTTDDVLSIDSTLENTYHNLSVYLSPYPTYTFLPVSDKTDVNNTNNESAMPLLASTGYILSTKFQDEIITSTTSTYVINQRTEIVKDTTVKYSTTEVISTSSTENETLATVSDRADTTTGPVFEPSSDPPTSPHENLERYATVGATGRITNDVLVPLGPNTERSLSGTFVDRESWDNVVQSAPVMAGLLNQHVSELNSSPRLKQSGGTAQNQHRNRRKRHIAAIIVDGERPHRRATAKLPAVRASVYNPNDVHEFARLIELPDDQMNNHVIVKFEDRMNAKLFDLCYASERKKSRHLIMFNSSRIILRISNFTLPHVMLTFTTTRPLTLLETQCGKGLVECQVEGTRVCIDDNNACDGVPNCGSSNAYDEDRVTCGFIDQQRNVYLAAATCVAVLVTILYILHYWLRICVPNVAEAFFVYYDSADNQLYLDSIMRSPTDFDGGHYMYNSALFDDENMEYTQSRKSTSIFRRVFSAFPKINLFRVHNLSSEILEDFKFGRTLSRVQAERSSFTESEMPSMLSAGVNREVQTGESLEMAYLNAINAYKADTTVKKPIKQRLPSVHDIKLRSFLPRTSSLDTSSDEPGPSVEGAKRKIAVYEEKEIHSTLYHPESKGLETENTRLTSRSPRAKRGAKCLRFNEHATFIPGSNDEEDEVIEMDIEKKTDEAHLDKKTSSSDFRRFFRKKKDHK